MMKTKLDKEDMMEMKAGKKPSPKEEKAEGKAAKAKGKSKVNPFAKKKGGK